MNQPFQLRPIYLREKLIHAIRNFFISHQFHELMTPVLNRALPLEPNVYAFQTDWHNFDKMTPLYLSTSPESGLKKMLAAGVGNCFALAPSFRNCEPADIEHNPEFLMLEWYREGADYTQIMDDVQQLLLFCVEQLNAEFELDTVVKTNRGDCLLEYQGKQLNLTESWPRISLETEFRRRLGVEMNQIQTLDKINQLAEKFSYQTADANWEQLFNQLFINRIEPHLPLGPCFVTDFPSQISPLCRVQPDKPYLAQRFEFYLARVEIGNGNTESTNVDQIQSYFSAEKKSRQTQNQTKLSSSEIQHQTKPPLPSTDHDFLQALETLNRTGLTYAGIGIGVDRLAMILADEDEIKTVNPFCL